MKLIHFILPILITAIACSAKESSEEDAVSKAIGNLNSDNYAERIEAVRTLSTCPPEQQDEVIKTLLRDPRNSDPEFLTRREDILHAVFERKELGIGKPSTGVTWARVLYFDKEGQIASFPYVEAVKKDSPADRAGLRSGDSIRAVNDVDLPPGDSYFDFMKILAKSMPGQTLKLRSVRLPPGKLAHQIKSMKGKKVVAKLVLGEPGTEMSRKAHEGEYKTWRAKLMRQLEKKPG